MLGFTYYESLLIVVYLYFVDLLFTSNWGTIYDVQAPRLDPLQHHHLFTWGNFPYKLIYTILKAKALIPHD